MVIRPMIVHQLLEKGPCPWELAVGCATMALTFLLTDYLVCRKFSKGIGTLEHWPFYFAGIIGLAMLLVFGMTMTTVKGMILTLILLYASLSDLKTREVRNSISIMILILAFLDFQVGNFASMLTGAAVVVIPQLATNMLNPSRPIGGADIKISTALAFLLGAEKGIFALVVGMLMAITVTTITNKLNNKDQKRAFPLVPFLWVGASIAYLL